jgi:ABC-type sugar transport system permease subunit
VKAGAQRQGVRSVSQPRTNSPSIPAAEQASTFSLWRKSLREARQAQWGDVTGYLFVMPAVVMFLVFNAWPIIRGLMIAFQDYRFLYEGWHPFNGLQNFIEIAGDRTFLQSFSRSAYFAALYIPAIIVIPLVVATLISNVKSPLATNIYRTISYLPVILPIAVSMLLWKHLFNSNFGYLNYALSRIFGPGVAPRWTSDPKWVIPTIVVSAVWMHAGFNMLLFLVGLYNINHEIYESAALDGAGSWRQFVHITLPLLRPVLVLTLVLAAGAIGVTAEPMIWYPALGGPAGPQDAALTTGYYAYKVAFLWGDLRWGYAAAMNLVLGLISMIMAALVFRLLGQRD